MQIVRPYGSSRTRQAEKGLRRILVEKTSERGECEIPVFACSDDKLVVAQWISTIDKIVRKPSGRKKPSPEQRELRHKLGNACWLRLTEGGHLQGASGESRALLSDLWWLKIHPYGSGTEAPQAGSKIKGRWYKAFGGDCESDELDPQKVAGIARRIEEHLYERECRIHPKSPAKRRGKIEARAESIATSVLRRRDISQTRDVEWTDEDVAAYTRLSDPALAIYKEALRLEDDGRRMSLPVAAEVLFDHWATVFPNADGGEPMTRKEASTTHPGMFALHSELKNCYRRLLKRTQKDTREHRKHEPKGRRLSALLPRDLNEALKLSGKQDANARLGHLVRLGKVIHYAASDGTHDVVKAIKDNWPENVDGNRFWNSDGQAEIKRAEAFVRVWRQALVLAALTLRDWVSREPFEGDILEGDEGKLEKALDPGKFERGYFKRKLRLLFGNRADSFVLETHADCLALLRGLIEGTANLRHAIFHFKGRGQLLAELAELPERFGVLSGETAQVLWQADAAGRRERLKADLRGAHVEQFLNSAQTAQVFRRLTGDAPTELPLPRFSRVLKRAQNAWAKNDAIKLPRAANRRALEEPARLCQYAVLKLIYERPFRSWLKAKGAEAISGWIDRAVARATEAAKEMQRDETARKVIAAKAARLPRPPAGSDVTDFFFALSAATASEMRVQSGYESDGEKAREQAEYIDHLLCDVVILSFVEFITDQKLNWLLELDAEQAPPEHPTCSLDILQAPEPVLDAEDWQVALYMILHLLPVESVGRLLHQLRKWDITASRDRKHSEEEENRLQRLFATMTLYLDMHDAKFEGGDALIDCEEFKALFKSDEGFTRVFSQTQSQETDRRIPRRGLREIMRFGHLPLLRTICGKAKIDDAAIDRVFAMEEVQDGSPSKIALQQQRREELHEKWVEKKKLEADDLQNYCEALVAISQHRHDSMFVNMVDHVRGHRTILAVLGRLVDYMGLFERDLYFATLALLSRHGLRPDDLFKEAGLKRLFNGQIIFALRDHKKGSPQAAYVLKELTKYFTTEVWAKGNPINRIRNDLAHLNMLQGDVPKPRLTDLVNQTRSLMAYDRKLKNAVSKSVIELMAREGIELRWAMKVDGNAHDLAAARLSSCCVKHLGGKKLILTDYRPNDGTVILEEKLQSDGYVAMITAACDGRRQRPSSIADYLPRVDWKASTEEHKSRENPARSGFRRTPTGRKQERRERTDV